MVFLNLIFQVFSSVIPAESSLCFCCCRSEQQPEQLCSLDLLQMVVSILEATAVHVRCCSAASLSSVGCKRSLVWKLNFSSSLLWKNKDNIFIKYKQFHRLLLCLEAKGVCFYLTLTHAQEEEEEVPALSSSRETSQTE